MSQHAVIVFEDGYPSYVAGLHDSLDLASAHVARMAEEVYGSPERFVFSDSDDIVLVDPDLDVVSVWNREHRKLPVEYADFDFRTYLEENAARRQRTILGFQITDLSGASIHGTAADPFDLAPTDVLTGAAVITAKEWATERDYLVGEVLLGDIQSAVLVEEIVEARHSASM